ncbi:hypothetical protein BDQ17DRAFT_1373586 [Cyathus striatus]|nr:hypothetical protein BDQ17DRAFT_1373586 [Cyathus striatus]
MGPFNVLFVLADRLPIFPTSSSPFAISLDVNNAKKPWQRATLPSPPIYTPAMTQPLGYASFWPSRSVLITLPNPASYPFSGIQLNIPQSILLTQTNPASYLSSSTQFDISTRSNLMAYTRLYLTCT